MMSTRTSLSQCSLLICLSAVVAAPVRGKPNFVVLLTDDQSWVGTSLRIDPEDARTQSDYFQTPNIERLAQTGMRFTRGYAPAPFCCPTRRSLLIGQTPARHIYQKDQRNWTTHFRKQLSLPQMLKQADPAYRSAHFGKWDMRFDNVSPQEMGYDVSDGLTGNGTGGSKGSGGPAAKENPKDIFGMTQRACAFMETQAKLGNPFFVQVSHYAVHLDIYYREASLTRARAWKTGRKHTMPEFAAMTSDVDGGIGLILDKIESLGVEDSTYVFFLSDNGGRNEIPGQRDKQLHRNHPLRDGKGSVYEGGIRVPFIVRGPGVQAGSLSRVPVTGLDLFPTLAELAGHRGNLPAALDGGSMTPVMFNAGRGQITRNRPFLIFHQAVARSAESALMLGDYKLVKTWRDNRLELFDLSESPSEKHDLSGSHPDKTRELHAMMVDFLDEVKAETRKTGTKAEVYRDATPLATKSAKPTHRVKHPNVLFLAIDDLNDWIGALGGHPQAKTPNLDRLMARGIRFTNAHCAAPVCSASRHALLSGLRPSTTGWYTNSSKKRSEYARVLQTHDTIPLPTYFKRNGYKTLAAGKIFHRGTSDVAGYDYWTEARPRFKWPKELAARGHGYQGKSGGHFHPFPPDGGAIYQKYQEGVSGQSLCWGALGKADMPPEGMPDEQIAAWAVKRLQQKHDQPFFLAVGFVRPHVPYTAPKAFFDLYPMDDVIVPNVPADEMDDIPLQGKAMAKGTIQGGDHWNVLSIGPNYWREMTRAYLACVSFVDAQAGKVLDALEASPYADNTIIVFWSDHGQHLGEKRHWRKQALWEESTRVPLSIYVPGSDQAGRTCDRPVSLIDLYPTLLELCELPPVTGLEGTSLTPQLQAVDARRSQPAITTWHYNNHAIRGPRWRYIRYRDGSEELYDHRTDPNEHVNQAANPKYASIKERFKRYLPETNVVPSSMKEGGLDAHGQRVKALQEEGVPAWLGKVPDSSILSRRVSTEVTPEILPFGNAGKIKMLYDCRQRPQSVYLKGKVYIVYNGEALPTLNGKGSAYPMFITYDWRRRRFTEPVRLSQKRSTDHHFSPIIWADEDDTLHVLHGCHRTPGTHLVSDRPVAAGQTEIKWRQGAQIAPKLSYPTVYRIHGERELIYYRTEGHTSSWTYRISADNGRTWIGPEQDVTDLDSRGRLDWSSYQTKLPSRDGRFLHVVYTDYDDNKNQPDPKRFFNARYQREVSNEWKYNLSYLKIDLQTHQVFNADGKVLRTPIDIDYSRANCEIWDTQQRGAGIPPVIHLDEDGEPSFLHVLSSEDNLALHHYYYVRRENGRWVQTRICASNHQWNSGYLSSDKKGGLHAYVIVGEGYLEGGHMDRHGGGRIEEWVSHDSGHTWNKLRDLTPGKRYHGWRFNNVQPVVRPDGSAVDGMLLFYGWKDESVPEAKAFLLHEVAVKH